MIDQRERFERAFDLFEMPEPAFDRLERRRERKQRNQRLAAGAVGIAVFVAAIWVVLSGEPVDRSQTPAVTEEDAGRVGFIGLPPEDATPSTPEHGELVASVEGRIGTQLYRAWLYEDGRMIWWKEGRFSYGATRHATGFLEQRLTAEGVALFRSEILATGLFRDGDLSLVIERGPMWGSIHVRDADRLVAVTWFRGDPLNPAPDGAVPATDEHERALARLEVLFTHPAPTWIPDRAWADETIRAYVPSSFRVCYGGFPSAIERDVILDVLPADASGLLSSRAVTEHDLQRDVFEGNRSVRYDSVDYCSEVTTDEARALVQVFEGPELERTGPFSTMESRLEYNFDIPGKDDLNVSFEPLLPHGEAICSVCG